jgi:murein L,D-transpeptidase YafK
MKLQCYVLIVSILPLPVFANNACMITTGLNVQAKKHILYICENGQRINKYKISIGRRGVGKTSTGDNKTPIGLYQLETPRKSTRFGVFIPIQYPTIQQRAAGYTGQDVGIHGPFWLFGWAGAMNTWVDWTKGCIALENKSQITSIADWLSNHPQAKILITSD